MRNFIIVGTPRTGSSALAQIINFHPKVACGWQWTARMPWWKKIKVAQLGLSGDFTQLPEDNRAHVEAICAEDTDWLGFRNLFRSSDKWLIHPRFCPPLWEERMEKHLRWIASKPEIAVIHITRADNLAWLKSYIFSRVTNIYIGRPYPEGLSIRIGKREALARVQSKHWLDSRLAQLKMTNPYLRVEYESLCKDKQSAGEAVIQYLGCDLSCYIVDENMMDQKQSTGTTREGIENYDELALEFAKRGLLEQRFDSHRIESSGLIQKKT